MPSKKAPAKPDQEVSISCRTIIHGLHGFGPGKADLLAWIEETGSLAEAARRMEMSYMRAWTLLREIQASLREPAVILARGGGKQAGAQLTPSGRAVLTLYRQMENALQTTASRHLQKLTGYFLSAQSDSGKS